MLRFLTSIGIALSDSRHSFARWLNAHAATLKQHSIFMAISLVVGTYSQYVLLHQGLTPGIFPDSRDYLNATQGIFASQHLVDPYRTPGYPVFLAVIFAFMGSIRVNAVVVVQTLFMVLALMEIYQLTYWLSRKIWAAMGTTIAVGVNLYILDWERSLLSETLSLWVLVTLMICFERYLATRRNIALEGIILCSLAIIFVRPFFVMLPILLLAVLLVWALVQQRLRQTWRSLLLATVIIYSTVLGYMSINALQNDYFGISYVSTVNLFGKILEYNMQNYSSDPAYGQLRQDANASVRQHRNEPWIFALQDYGYRDYSANHFAILGSFSTDIVVHHPLAYLRKTWPDIVATWEAPATFYTAYTPTEFGATLLVDVSQAELHWFYAAFPLLLLGTSIAVWPLRKHATAVFLFFSAWLIAFTIFITAALGFDEFYRHRSPVDWLMIMLVFVVISRGIDGVLAQISRMRVRL